MLLIRICSRIFEFLHNYVSVWVIARSQSKRVFFCLSFCHRPFPRDYLESSFKYQAHHEPEVTGCGNIRQFWLLRGDVTNLLRSRHRIRFAVALLGLAVTILIAGWNYCFNKKLFSAYTRAIFDCVVRKPTIF